MRSRRSNDVSDERERSEEDAVAYLRSLDDIRRELNKSERSVAAGRVATLADLDKIIREIRQR